MAKYEEIFDAIEKKELRKRELKEKAYGKKKILKINMIILNGK